MRRAASALLVATLGLAGAAQADYVQVRTSAIVRANASSSSAELARPPVGTNLLLVEPGQTNGFYHVEIPAELGASEDEGFVFRTLVRGFVGAPPGPGVPGVTLEQVSDVVYEGIPINRFPEFPITVLDKGHYVIGYSEDFEGPAWVFYHIGPVKHLESFPRPGFRTDQDTTARIRSQDYTNSGFDRGHMAPNFALGSRFGAEGRSQHLRHV